MGTLVKAYGQYRAGKEYDKGARADARQLERRAGKIRASSQRAAAEERREGRYVDSKARARLASSGAGSSDPTAVNLLADIEATAQYNALTQLWEGEEAAKGEEYAARVRRREGKAARTAGKFEAMGTLLGSDQAQTFYQKYG